jgi:hypothetical protein
MSWAHTSRFALASWLSLFVGLVAAALTGCEPCYADPKLSVRLFDAAGQRVPIESARFEQDGKRICLGGSYEFCEEATPGEVLVTLTAHGETVSRAVTLERTKVEHAGFGTCEGEPATQLDLQIAGCPAPSGIVLQGNLLDTRGVPADARVSISAVRGRYTYDAALTPEPVACKVAPGGAFQCPALTRYLATYEVKAELNTSVLIQNWQVEPNDCAVPISTLDLSVQSQVCPPASFRPVESVTGLVWLKKPETRVALRVSADGGPWVDCSVDEARAAQVRPGWVAAFGCPALTPTGGGKYVVELFIDGTLRETFARDVRDDGCVAKTEAVQSETY